MPSIQIPVDLELPAPPGAECLIGFEADLERLLAHTGSSAPLASVRVLAHLPDGRKLRTQYQADAAGPRLVLLLPPDVAAANGVRLTLVAETQPDPLARAARVLFNQGAQQVEIGIDGAPFATYRYDTREPGLPRPYFHPILGPTGASITQDGEFPGTDKGHIWHTGLVLAHQNFTDGNNWQTGSSKFSRMRHVAFDVMESGPLLGRFVQRLEWLSVSGERTVFHETRTIAVPVRTAARRCLDVDTTITCGDQAAVWNATPYHLLAIRVPDSMLVGKGGTLLNSEGQSNPADGTPARWLDYSGMLAGKSCGVALFDHPQNPRHPTPWLNFQAQTVGAAPGHREPLPWKPGEARRFRYRVYFHEGDAQQGKVAEEYAAYGTVVRARIGPPALIA